MYQIKLEKTVDDTRCVLLLSSPSLAYDYSVSEAGKNTCSVIHGAGDEGYIKLSAHPNADEWQQCIILGDAGVHIVLEGSE